MYSAELQNVREVRDTLRIWKVALLLLAVIGGTIQGLRTPGFRTLLLYGVPTVILLGVAASWLLIRGASEQERMAEINSGLPDDNGAVVRH